MGCFEVAHRKKGDEQLKLNYHCFYLPKKKKASDIYSISSESLYHKAYFRKEEKG